MHNNPVIFLSVDESVLVKSAKESMKTAILGLI